MVAKTITKGPVLSRRHRFRWVAKTITKGPVLSRHHRFRWWTQDASGPLHFNDIECEYCMSRPIATKVVYGGTSHEPSEQILCNVCSAEVLLWHSETWDVRSIMWF